MNQILARQLIGKFTKANTAPTHSAGLASLRGMGDPVQRQQAQAINAANRPRVPTR